MGGWLEVLRERPSADADSYSQRQSLLIGAYGCHPLVKASRYLGRGYRGAFPALARVCVQSSAYDDESLWLDAHQANDLLAEFRRVRRIARREEFLTGLDGGRFADLWREGEAPEDFEALLDRIEDLLAAADGPRWVHLSL
jgi:hypothetical protein